MDPRSPADRQPQTPADSPPSASADDVPPAATGSGAQAPADPASPPAHATVEANGLRIGYDMYGDGPPLVLLHGASSAGRRDFAAQVPLLARGFHLYLPDARGHATTRWSPASALRSEDLVADVEAFSDRLGLAAFHLLGFSLGADTALRFALRHPGRVRSLVIIGYSIDREPRTSVVRRSLDPARIDRADPALAAVLEELHGPVQGRGAWRRLLPAIVAGLQDRPDIDLGALRALTMPILVACGDRDPVIPVGQAWALQRQLPVGRLLVVPGCGHQVASRCPGVFNAALATFYRSVGAWPTAGSGQVVRAPADNTGEVLAEIRPSA